jgi:hypothetical protein
MADQDESQPIGTITQGWRNNNTGQVTKGPTQPLMGRQITKEQFGLAPAIGEDNSNFPQN